VITIVTIATGLPDSESEQVTPSQSAGAIPANGVTH